MSLKDTLRGTGVALITPFTETKSVDFNALEKVLEFVLHGKVEYLVVLGTTGETPTLTKQEKLDILQFVYEKVDASIPIVVGIGGNNTNELISDLETFPLERATAILSASPYYNKPSQEGIFQHYKAFADAAPKPVILYNVPGRTGSNISAATTLRLAEASGNIQGTKEASGNMIQCMHILKNRPSDFLVTSGDDHLSLPLIALGMDGVISVAANCYPKEFSEMVRLSLAGDFEAAQGLHYFLLDCYDLLFEENNPAGAKAFLAEMGIIQNYLRLPVTPLSAAVHDKIRTYISSHVR